MIDSKIIECPDGLVGYDITLTRLGPWVQLPLWIWCFILILNLQYMFNLIIILYNIYINKNIIIFNNHKSKVIIYHLHIINSISFLFILRINTSYFFLFIETLYHLYYTKIITALTICNSTHLIICSLFKNQTVNSFFEFLLK